MTLSQSHPRPLLVHFSAIDDWRTAQRDGAIAPASLHTEGFVHLSTTWQAPATIGRFYANRTDLLALAIDPDVLPRGLLQWDESHPGEFFPHVYGEIPVAAVRGHVQINADPSSWFADWPALPGTTPLPATTRLVTIESDRSDEAGELIDRAVVARTGSLAPHTTARARARLTTAQGWGLGIESDSGTLLCVVLGVPMLADDGAGPPIAGWCHLGTVMADPAWWGKGFATRLLVEAVVAMRQRGYHHAELWTQHDNLRAQAVYERLGWHRSERPPSPFEGDILLHYTLALHP